MTSGKVRGRWAAGWLGAGLLLAASGLWMMQAQQRSSNFTGGTVTPVAENSQAAIAHFRFAPGARTKWHIHEGGQIILVEEGVAHVQEKGGPVIELHAGDIIWTKPGVAHWHGAAPDQGGVQFNVTRGGITWLDEVTDEEFRAQPKK
jgi:quercetin dioxygenase-like cupin family protein